MRTDYAKVSDYIIAHVRPATQVLEPSNPVKSSFIQFRSYSILAIASLPPSRSDVVVGGISDNTFRGRKIPNLSQCDISRGILPAMTGFSLHMHANATRKRGNPSSIE
jgi:hypothetical protein